MPKGIQRGAPLRVTRHIYQLTLGGTWSMPLGAQQVLGRCCHWTVGHSLESVLVAVPVMVMKHCDQKSFGGGGVSSSLHSQVLLYH